MFAIKRDVPEIMQSHKNTLKKSFHLGFKDLSCRNKKKRTDYGWTFSPQVLQNRSVGSSSALHFLHSITFPAGWPGCGWV
jgi:hypothetical protein